MRILCAVDGSECSQWGLHTLEALADREPEDVTLLHVVDPSSLRADRGGNPVAETCAMAAMEKAGRVLLRRQSDQLESLSDRLRQPHVPPFNGS